MKMEYDLVFGFGPACSCSQTLRRAGLQLLSFPFDWIGPAVKLPGWDEDVRHRTNLLASDFHDWLHQEDFEYQGDHTNGMAKYWNNRLRLVFVHDFPIGVPLSESFLGVAAKYARRIERFLGLIHRSKRILVARLDRPDLDYRTPLDECRYARETLSKAFAPAQFDFLLIQQDDEIPFGSQELETVEPGFFRLRFDYRDTRPDAEPAIPRLDWTAAAVAPLFSVREYRTKEEIAAYQLSKKRKHWAKYGATNIWQYHWRKLTSHKRGGSTATKTYDLAVSFGPLCSCSQTLRRAGLQFLSFPFDWLGILAGSAWYADDVRRRADLIASEFEDWLRIEDFMYDGENTNGMYKYRNTRNKLSFIHDFPIGVPLEQSFPAVATKFARRTARLLDLMRKSRKILIVRLDRPNLDYRTPIEDCLYAREVLSKKFPHAEFDFLLMCQNPGIPFGCQKLETPGPGIFRLEFDYRDKRPGIDPNFPDLILTSAAVAQFFSVREYRTKEEIAAYRLSNKRKRWAKYGASNAWQYHWRKFLARFRKGASQGAS